MADGRGRALLAPTSSIPHRESRPRRGQYGEEPKSVKKNAALLHFLAFGAFDHIFGVLRGERLAAKTMAASLLRKPARAVIRPAGANIARSPVSLRSTVAPCSQPRNPLRRASRAFASSGHLFRFLFGCPKRKAQRQPAVIKGPAARWAGPPSRHIKRQTKKAQPADTGHALSAK